MAARASCSIVFGLAARQSVKNMPQNCRKSHTHTRRHTHTVTHTHMTVVSVLYFAHFCSQISFLAVWISRVSFSLSLADVFGCGTTWRMNNFVVFGFAQCLHTHRHTHAHTSCSRQSQNSCKNEHEAGWEWRESRGTKGCSGFFLCITFAYCRHMFDTEQRRESNRQRWLATEFAGKIGKMKSSRICANKQKAEAKKKERNLHNASDLLGDQSRPRAGHGQTQSCSTFQLNER